DHNPARPGGRTRRCTGPGQLMERATYDWVFGRPGPRNATMPSAARFCQTALGVRPIRSAIVASVPVPSTASSSAVQARPPPGEPEKVGIFRFTPTAEADRVDFAR